jgi:hypothetical protein
VAASNVVEAELLEKIEKIEKIETAEPTQLAGRLTAEDCKF